MRLEQGTNLYVERRQVSSGISFATGYKTYRAFYRRVGNLKLSEINVHHVLQYLDCPATSTAVYRRRHSLLQHLFEYWVSRGEMTGLPMPPNRPLQRSNYLPYIYTKEEIRSLLRSTPLPKTLNDKIHYKTLRVALITLYATGATSGEVTRLFHQNVDLQHGSIIFPESRLRAERFIPIGRDLVRVALQYVAWKERTGLRSEFFFPRVDGKEISPRALRAHFERLRTTANIDSRGKSSHRPLLRDLRPTFAVHRITSWIRRKEDLNQMLPALAAYMGNAGLETTERYLQLAPERFRGALNKLSPQKSHIRWRDDAALLEFLANL
jgi:site-specific recombinase XerD